MSAPVRARALLAGLFLLAPLVRAAGDAPPVGEAKPAAAAAEVESAAFKSDNPLHAEADAVLNEARANLGDAAAARQRIARLEGVAARFPDYKFRADALYYAGLNWQTLGQDDQAAAAFEAALRVEPDIAKETPIVAYLKAARGHTFVRRANLVLLAVLVAVLVPALGRLTRADAATLPWGRLFAVYGAVVAVWTALVLLLPATLGPPGSGLADFPKPTLSNFRLGQIGDGPLRALLGYGAGAILATLPVVAAAARIRRPGRRIFVTTAGVLAVVTALMGLYGVRHLYADARYSAAGQRLVFLVRSIDTPRDVPDAMLPLYDTNFAARVRAARALPAK